MTNTTIISKQQQLKNYLIECIDFDGAGYTGIENTIKNLYKQSKEELWHINNEYERINSWLLWLPNCLNNVFSYYDIKQIMQWFWYKTKDIYKLNDIYWHNLTKIIINNK